MMTIAGVTGRTGRLIANTLLAKGTPVRVLVRDEAKGAEWKQRGAEVAIAEMSDVAALTRALKGSDAAYLLNPPSISVNDIAGDARKAAQAYREAIEASGVKHVVFLSSVAAQQPAGTGPIVALHEVEAVLRASTTPITFLRAAYFMENLNPAPPQFFSMLGSDTPVEMIATQDIAAFAVELLLQGRSAPAVVEVSGPSPVTMRALAEHLGKPLVEIPPAAHAQTLLGFGVPPHAARAYAEMQAGLLSGHVAFEQAPRRGPTSALQFFTRAG